MQKKSKIFLKVGINWITILLLGFLKTLDLNGIKINSILKV